MPLLEMHCHTSERSPCSHIRARDLVRQVEAKQLQGLVITDHHSCWTDDELKELRREAGVPDHFLILSGQEVRTPELGDVLVYGAKESFPRGTSLRVIRRRAPEAALVFAHPFRDGRLPPAGQLLHPEIDAVEIFSSNHSVRENSRGLSAWHEHRFTAIAGTDTHGSGYAGTYPTQLDHPIESVEELAQELRAGRCRPFFKEIPRSGSTSLVTEVTIGTKGEADEDRPRLVIREFKRRSQWRKAERAFQIMCPVAEAGFAEGTYRVPRPLDADPRTMTLIEQGMRGKSLFHKLLVLKREEGRELIEMAAVWLARLHDLGLRITPVEDYKNKEVRRLGRYLKRFEDIDHSHTERVRELVDEVSRREYALIEAQSEALVQGHGDYHPKNIIVGQDQAYDRSTTFVSAIDFESSYLFPRAFDVGCFVAQHRNQLFDRPDVLERYPESLFVDAYRRASGQLPEGFEAGVELYRARTNLSIAAYLIKLGLGESPDLWRVIVEAEAALAR